MLCRWINDGSLSVVESFLQPVGQFSDPSYVVTVLNSDSNYVTAAAVGTPTAASTVHFPRRRCDRAVRLAAFLTGGFDGVVLDPTQDGAVEAADCS